MLLTDKVAIVTGGATGIGRAVCLAFAREGANVVVNYSRSETEALSTVDSVERLGRKAIAVKADVSDAEQARNLIARAVQEFHRVDILVNSAGTTVEVKLPELSDDEWNRIIGVNLNGAFFCTKAAAKEMLKQGKGAIVNISSSAFFRGGGSCAAYTASKAGVIGLTRVSARQLAPNIRVNCVAPGNTLTPFIAHYSEELLKSIAADTPLKRVGQPEDIADVVLFLASDMARYMTGQTLLVDGGRAVH